MVFASVLQSLRKTARLTQEEMADVLNIPKRTYGSWERSERQPDIEMLCKIADYFGVTTDYLLGRTPMEIEIKHEAPPPLGDGEFEIVIEPNEKTPAADELERRIVEVVAKELKKRGL